MNVTIHVISVYSGSNYISVQVNAKCCVLISVSVFELKEYNLDHIGKKQMPICRICDPPGVLQTGQSSMHTKCAGTGVKTSTLATMQGALKNLEVCLGFKTIYFITKKTKRSGSVKHVSKTLCLTFNYLDFSLLILTSSHLSVPVRCAPNLKMGLRASRLQTDTWISTGGT